MIFVGNVLPERITWKDISNLHMVMLNFPVINVIKVSTEKTNLMNTVESVA